MQLPTWLAGSVSVLTLKLPNWLVSEDPRSHFQALLFGAAVILSPMSSCATYPQLPKEKNKNKTKDTPW